MNALNTVLASVQSLADAFLASLPQILIAIAVLTITWFVTRSVNKIWSNIAEKMNLRNSLEELFRKLSVIAIWIVGAMIAAMTVFPDFTPAKLLTIIGLSSIAIGFAFKDVFENFLAGILILLREPFALKDFVECQGIEGQVEEITIRDTRIRQTDGQAVVLPNAMLFKNPVTVRTAQKLRRLTVMCGVGYGEDVDKSRKIIRKAVEGLDTVDKDRPIQIFAQSFGASSIDFEVTWWTGSTPLEIRESRDKVIAAVKRALDDAGVEIPFPYRTLTFKEPLNTKLLNANVTANGTVKTVSESEN